MPVSRFCRVVALLCAYAVLTACGHATSQARPADSQRFEVPTYRWDKGAAMQALVSGRLAFTDQGCTLLVPAEGSGLPIPVLFPNASGVRFGNGMRAVVETDTGKTYAVEGQVFSYAGGFVPPGDSWTEQCGDYSPDDIAHVNAEPEFPALTSAPEPYAGTLADRVPTREERGWYAVPTLTWNPGDGGDLALIEGRVRMTPDGCATVEAGKQRTGLVLPNAWGTRSQTYTETQAIFSWFSDGSAGVMAENKMSVSFTGGFTDLSGEFGRQWRERCPASPVGALFLVQDDKPWK